MLAVVKMSRQGGVSQKKEKKRKKKKKKNNTTRKMKSYICTTKPSNAPVFFLFYIKETLPAPNIRAGHKL